MISYPIFTHVIDLWEISQYGPTEFYAYEINAAAPGDILPLKHIKDARGLDACYASFDEAKTAIMAQLHINGRVRILIGDERGKFGTIYNCAYDRPAPWHVRPDGWSADVPGIAYKADELEVITA